jgi:hypothetical protein
VSKLLPIIAMQLHNTLSFHRAAERNAHTRSNARPANERDFQDRLGQSVSSESKQVSFSL